MKFGGVIAHVSIVSLRHEAKHMPPGSVDVVGSVEFWSANNTINKLQSGRAELEKHPPTIHQVRGPSRE